MEAPAHQPVRILLVDDIESNLVALEALLGSPSVTITRARSGQEAIGALGGDEFALILLDVRMPDMDGFETATAIRQAESTRSIPIIFVTAHGKTQQELAKAYALGASDFIEKPIDPDALRAKVRVITDLSRLVRQTRLEAEARHEQHMRDERQRWETEALRARVEEQERATAAEHAARVDAEQANRLKDDFLATLSHELRAPLNAIVGWAAMLKMRGAAEPTFSKAVDVIERNARVQSRLIDDMLDTSRIVAGKLRLEMATVDITHVVDRAIEAIRPAAERKRVSLAAVQRREVHARGWRRTRARVPPGLRRMHHREGQRGRHRAGVLAARVRSVSTRREWTGTHPRRPGHWPRAGAKPGGAPWRHDRGS
jgi:CheY-like chemotaxis protein